MPSREIYESTSRTPFAHLSRGERITTSEFGELIVVPDIVIPELLKPDQHLLEQPPFLWMFVDPDIFPYDFFDPAKLGDGLFHKGEVSTVKAFIATRKRSGFMREAREVRNQKYTADEFNERFRRAQRYMDQFPFVSEYLKMAWPYFYDSLGNPNTELLEISPMKTYAAYASDMFKTYKIGDPWHGLDKEPLRFSHSVTDAVPHKGGINRWYRLVVSSEALR